MRFRSNFKCSQARLPCVERVTEGVIFTCNAVYSVVDAFCIKRQRENVSLWGSH